MAPFWAKQTPFQGQTGPNTVKSGLKHHPSLFCPSMRPTRLCTAPHGGTGTRFWHFGSILGLPANIPRNAAKQAPGDRNLPLVVRLGHSEGWKPPKVGVCMSDTSPQNRDLVCLARDAAILPLWAARRVWGPYKPILGPTDTVLGPNRSKHGQKRTQSLPTCILFIDNNSGTLRGNRWRLQDSVVAFGGDFF